MFIPFIFLILLPEMFKKRRFVHISIPPREPKLFEETFIIYKEGSIIAAIRISLLFERFTLLSYF